jgi:hypothetical protein
MAGAEQRPAYQNASVASLVLHGALRRTWLAPLEVVLSGIMARSFVLVLSSILALLGWFHDFLDQQLRHFESSP